MLSIGEHHSTNILYVEEVSLETSQDEILHTLSEWKEMGIENQLEDSVFIVKSMISWMKETPENTRILICRDRAFQKIQGIGFFEISSDIILLKQTPLKKFLDLIYLASHPKNIKASSTNVEEQTYKGVGRKIVQKAALIVTEERLSGIMATSYHSELFFEKCHFTRVTPTLSLQLGIDYSKNQREGNLTDSSFFLSLFSIGTYQIEENPQPFDSE